ncbi:MAG TPA: sigma 54-interacting transcriptional regulator [Myxococcota bacterium]|mgnify:CR=1 FL=1|nr:sigma 54-interacting transcriptional regulator [Myxococcota bacterium]HQP95575.1 sigma 54-interacting transcriptional regulator [Myxococcota bacterium]
MEAGDSDTTLTELGRADDLTGFMLSRDDEQDLFFDSQSLSVGSSRENDLVLDDPGVSRHHFRIERTAEGWTIRDLDSTNGTTVDRVRVGEALLRSGSEIRAGRTVLRFFPMSDLAPRSPCERSSFHDAVGDSLEMRRIFALLERVAPTDATVLIEGETGSGKEVFARGIHKSSRRPSGPFVVFDCGATPRDLVESILFGHERGAFTGAVASREGLFEQADGGTIFLDELGELPLETQPKLLRVLDSREVRRVGGSVARKVNVRVIAATNRGLDAEVAAGRFRSDLFFRLAVIRVKLPPLRERPTDIPILAGHYLRQIGSGVARFQISDQAMAALIAWKWPGNVRELFNALERAVTICPSSVIDVQDLPPAIVASFLPAGSGGPDSRTELMNRSFKTWSQARGECLFEFESSYLRALIDKCGTNIALAARCADMDRKYLRELLKKHGLYRSTEVDSEE